MATSSLRSYVTTDSLDATQQKPRTMHLPSLYSPLHVKLPSTEEVTPLLDADTLEPSKAATVDAESPKVAKEAIAKALGGSTIVSDSATATASAASSEVVGKPAGVLSSSIAFKHLV